LSIFLGYLKYNTNNTGSLHNSPTNLKGIPILTYHCIDDNVWGDKPLFVSPGIFDEQMQYLKSQGYTAITFNELNRIDTLKNPILITFDDGYEDNFINAYPILKKYGLKATIFLIENKIGKPKHLTLKQIKQMHDIIDFQSHTMTHPHLAKLSSAKINYELSESKKKLEYLLKKKINVIAYPYGSYDERVIKLAKKYYTYGLTVHFGRFSKSLSDDFQIKRISIANQTHFSEFKKLFKS
jgi:peptidoglycan/xylan/chitin deacetylase (PgdA/CDA1 family)